MSESRSEDSGTAQGAQCPQCGKVLAHRRALTRHVRNVHRVNHRCTTCNHGFSQLRDLERHEAVHGSSRREYECLECKVRVARADNCRRHLVRQHGGDASRPSSEVLLCFRVVENARSSKVREHVCPDCNASYTQLGTLNRHRATHRSDQT